MLIEAEGKVLVHLVTRIPEELHRRIKAHCITTGVSLMDFVAEALEERLNRKKAPNHEKAPKQ
jgi:predicted HicB family RNase H-like nuclease